MARRVNGITIAINADTNGVTAGLKDLTTESISLSKQLKTVESLLDMDPGNAELAATKQELLARSVETTKRRLEALKGAQQDVQAAVARGDIGTEEYVAFQRELVTTEKRLKDLEKQENDTGEETEELAVDTREAGTEMEKTERQSGKLGEALKEGIAKGAEMAAAAVTAMAAAATAAVAGIVNAAGAAAEYGDNIDKMSQKLGMSSDAYQEWDFIMQHSGSDIDKMTTSMKTLADAVQEPTEKSTAAFEKLGISIEAAKNMSQEDLFNATITALQKMESGTERTALATDLLGKSAMDLGALLNTSAEDTEAMRKQVHELGGVMDEEAVKTSAQFQDSLQNVKTAIGGITRNIGADFMPSMIKIMDSVSEIASGNLAAIRSVEGGVNDFVKTIGKTVGNLTQTANRILPIIVNAISRALPSLLRAGLSIVETLGSAIMRNLPMLINTAQSIITDLVTSLIGELPQLLRVGFGVIVQIAEGIAASLPELIPQLVDVVLEIVDVLTDPNTLGKLIDAAFAIVDALIDGLLSEESINKFIEKIPDIVTNIVDVLINSVGKLLDAASKIITALCDYFGKPQNIQKIKDAASAILVKLGEGLRDLVGNLIPFMRDVAQAWAEMFIGDIDYDATASEVIRRLGEAFVHNFAHSPEQLGEWIYDLTHGRSDENEHFATGGIVRHPTRAMIGENGQELILPLENNTGWMDQLARRISGAGGMQIGAITVNVTGTEQVGREVVAQIDTALRQYQIMQQRGVGGTGW
jgi:phage-related minor tail protein